MFIETAIGVGVAIVVMVAVAQLVGVIAYQRVNVSQSRLATRELGNAMERVMAASWDELNVDDPPQLSISVGAEQRLDDARLSVNVRQAEEDPSVKQIAVQIDWLNRAGQRVDPIRLVAWKHARQQGNDSP